MQCAFSLVLNKIYLYGKIISSRDQFKDTPLRNRDRERRWTEIKPLHLSLDHEALYATIPNCQNLSQHNLNKYPDIALEMVKNFAKTVKITMKLGGDFYIDLPSGS